MAQPSKTLLALFLITIILAVLLVSLNKRNEAQLPVTVLECGEGEDMAVYTATDQRIVNDRLEYLVAHEWRSFPDCRAFKR